jgi:hypothetical protein
MWVGDMLRGRIDISRNMDGEPVVLAVIDLVEEEVRAFAHAVRGVIEERFRMSEMSGDDVLQLRELTSLADELGELGPEGAIRTLVFSPARLSLWRDALDAFARRRGGAEWIREEDREPLARIRELLPALDELSAEAVRAAISPEAGRR